MDVLSPFISILCHSDWLFQGKFCPVLMLPTQAVRGLPSLRAPGIVSCIISFSRQLPCFPLMWPWNASSLLWRCLTVPSFLHQEPTHLFSLLFSRIFLSSFISKASDVSLHSFWVFIGIYNVQVTWPLVHNWLYQLHVTICPTTVQLNFFNTN